MAGRWSEAGDRVMVARYPHLNQNIGLIIGRDADVVIDTRSTAVEAREVLDDIRRVSRNPIGAVINTHGHSDHVFGNATFRPVEIWAHAACATFIESTAERQRAAGIEFDPGMTADFEAVIVDLPDRLVDRTTELEVGGRHINLLALGRGHTDHDLAVGVRDAGVVFAGDQVVKNDAQFFGDSFPLEWAETLGRLAALEWSALITGHGSDADRSYLDDEIGRHRTLVTIARQGQQRGAPWEDLVASVPYPVRIARVALARTYAHLADAP